VEVRIGVIYSGREIEVDMGDDADAAKVKKSVEPALTKKEDVLWLVDRHGREVGVPADKISYVEIGAASSNRRMGFVS
jgi:hypothetical protein